MAAIRPVSGTSRALISSSAARSGGSTAPRIRPGDQLFQERRFHGYKLADTKFAGPTMFSSGDTVHRNQHGAPVAKERSTAIRYLAAEAEKRGMFRDQLKPIHRWTSDELEQDREAPAPTG